MLATFKVGGEPEGVELRPDGKVVYVTSEEDSQVTAIDAIDLKPIKTFKVGKRPRSTAFLPDSTRAYVPAENGGRGLGYGRDEARRAEDDQAVRRDGEADGLGASPDGSHVFITTGRGKNVVIIDTKTNQPVASIEVGDRPWGIAVVAGWQDRLHGERAVE